MRSTILGRLVATLLLVIGAVVVAVVAYGAGVSAGAAGTTGTAAAGAVHWGYWAGFGLPWFFFGPVFFLLFILFIVWIVRAAAWGGSRGRGHWGPGPGGPGWGDPESRLAEWHRRAHEQGEEPRGGSDPSDPGRR